LGGGGGGGGNGASSNFPRGGNPWVLDVARGVLTAGKKKKPLEGCRGQREDWRSKQINS